MAITRGSHTAAATTVFHSTSLAFNITITQTNCTLIVFAYGESQSTHNFSANCAGGAMTNITGGVIGAGAEIDAFYFINPPLGSGTVTIISSIPDDLMGFAVEYGGTNQVTQPDNDAATNFGTASPFDQNLTPFNNNCWLVGMWTKTNTNYSAGTGTTLLDNATSRVGSIAGTGDSGGPVTGGISSMIELTGVSQANACAGIILSVNAPGSVGGFLPQIIFM